MTHHTEDYKKSAVKYYVRQNENIRNTCKIFDCKKSSLQRWITRYKTQKNIHRKTRSNHNLKITPEITQFVKQYVRKYNTTTLWELSKLVYEKYNVHLTDGSIHNILQNHHITRKRLRSKYYPEKKEGSKQFLNCY